MAKKSQGAKAKRGTSSKPEGRKSAEDNESGAEPARGGSREGKGGKSRKEDKASKGSGKHLGGRGGDCGEDAQLHAAIEAGTKGRCALVDLSRSVVILLSSSF
jgi:hypothetical protein